MPEHIKAQPAGRQHHDHVHRQKRGRCQLGIDHFQKGQCAAAGGSAQIDQKQCRKAGKHRAQQSTGLLCGKQCVHFFGGVRVLHSSGGTAGHKLLLVCLGGRFSAKFNGVFLGFVCLVRSTAKQMQCRAHFAGMRFFLVGLRRFFGLGQIRQVQLYRHGIVLSLA